jgi:hypothetical protein
MPQLVTQIILLDQDYAVHAGWDAAYGEDKVQAVVEYVNGLLQRYFSLDELPPNAVRSYHADYYMAQVLNGNIHQFVHNSRWSPRIVENVSAALDTFGLVHQAALFCEVRDFIERDRPRLEGYLANRYGSPATRPYMDDLARIGGDFFERFIAHPDGDKTGARQISIANAAWISSWPETRWVSAAVFEQELDKLETVIPDLPARKRRAKKNRPWQYRRIFEVMATATRKLIRVGGIHRGASQASISYYGLPTRDTTTIGPTIEGRMPNAPTIDVAALRSAIERCGLTGTGTLGWKGEGSYVFVDVLRTHVEVTHGTGGGTAQTDCLLDIMYTLRDHGLHVWDPQMRSWFPVIGRRRPPTSRS